MMKKVNHLGNASDIFQADILSPLLLAIIPFTEKTEIQEEHKKNNALHV